MFKRFLIAILFIAGILCTSVTFGQAKETQKQYGGTIARFDKAPKLDGTMEPGEWKPAVRIPRFQQRRGGDFVDQRKTATYLGFTEKRLYLALACELPPDGELIANKTNRDSSLIKDDALEIWVDPHWKNRKAGKGNQTYFQTMVNSLGTIYDKKYDPAGGAPNMGWNADWKVANGIHKKTGPDSPLQTDTGIWICEMSIPFKDIGIEGSPIGREIGVMVARQWKRPGGQKPWFPHSRGFSSWIEYPHFHLTEDQPTVQIMGFGDELFEGNLEMKALIINPGPARTVLVHSNATSSNMPGVEKTQPVELPANSEVTYEFTNNGRFHASAKHHLDFAVTDEKEDTTYLRYAMDWREPKGQRWAVKTGPEPKKAIKLAYYPSYEFIRVYVDPTELGEDAENIQQAHVTVVDPDGEIVTEGTMQWDKAPGEQRFDVGELDEGTYTAQIVPKGHDTTYERNFTRQYFPWEDNGLGETNDIYPPFEPVQVDDRTLEVVMRRYTLSGLGLWSSVQATGNDKNAEYEELLTGPITLRTADGSILSGAGELTSEQPHAVVYEGEATRPDVTVKTRTTTEFDGCMKVEMTLAPGSDDEQLDGLYLDIPMKDSIAPLYHASTTSLRQNPAGHVPDGTGRIWDSRDNPDGNWFGNFKPYLWAGGAERGLSWFADNDRNWVLKTGEKPEDFAPSLELIRRDGTLHMRVHFVQKPVTIDEPRTIVFGLMASPAKPMPENWRQVLFEHGADNRQTINFIGAQYWGSPSIMYSKYPINGDFSGLDKMQELRLGGKMGDFWRYYNERNLSGDISDSTYMSPKKVRQLLGISFRRSRRAGDNYFAVYWEEFHRTLNYHPEVPVFKEEWSGNYDGTGHHSYPESYLDFACYYGAKFIRRGIGLYFDNTFPKRAYDPVTTNAYRLPNGQIQPSANMWRHRRYLRRIWTLHQQMAPANTPPIMMLHMTNTHILPYMVFNQVNYDLEWFYGPKPLQAKFTPDLLRAQSIGLQTGNYPVAMSHTRGPGDGNKRKATKTRFGALMVHEIRTRPESKLDRKLLDTMIDFGYGRDDCRVYNYWDRNAPIQPSDDRVKWLLLKSNGKLMILLATWNPDPASAQLRLDMDMLDVRPQSAVDTETGESLPFDGHELKLELERYGIRLITLE